MLLLECSVLACLLTISWDSDMLLMYSISSLVISVLWALLFLNRGTIDVDLWNEFNIECMKSVLE